jgi:cell division septation protein DedD
VTDPSHDVGEDAFHEIQLSGKQLVFLFMATTVVSVVIFLCGVLVGRGVRAEALSASSVANVSTSTTSASAGGVVVPDRTPPPADPPAPAPEDPTKYSYQKRLDSDKTPVEALKPAAESKRTATSEAPKPMPASPPAPSTPAPAPAASAPAAATTSSPSPTATRTGTWAVQVVALTDRAAATAVMQRLTSKGYPAFLVHPQPGAPVQHYKVQVGRYNDHGEADQVKARLKKEEQFEPFIVR